MSTKKLAKELGLVRKHSKSSTGQKKTLVSNQIFAYLIVIDFESTCWREKNNFGQEIIEFPAVLLNTSTGEVESEFQTYVQPQEHPVLSEFCTVLTGITQAQVEVGVPLQICLSRFSRWLQTLQLQRGVVFPKDPRGSSASSPQKPCAFLTWSDWDLGVCLQYECKRKQLNKPDVLNSWIDLRATYKLFYSRKPKGLNGALQDLGIQFAGREHSGLDDARNTARLADRMMRDGCVMKITRSLERAPLKAKPLFGNISQRPGNKKENNNTKPEAPAAISRSSLNVSPEPPQKELLLENIKPVNDTKKNSPTISVDCQSLVSPKTLLNGLTTPLYGNSNLSRMVRVGTNFSSPITVNNPSPHNSVIIKSNNSGNLVLFPTTVDCMSHPLRPHLTFETEATAERWGREVTLVSEIEEGCGSYDDVVLECDDIDDAYPNDERFDTDHALLCDAESYLSAEPIMHVPFGEPNDIAHRLTTDCKTSSSSAVFAAPKPAASHTTPFQKGFSSSTTTNSSLVRPNKFLSKTALQGQSKSFSTSSNIVGPRLNSKTMDLSRSSSKTPCASFARPKPVVKELNTSAVHSRLQTERKSKTLFTIYSDLEKHSTPALQPPLSKTRSVVPPLLSSSSTHRSANRSSLSINRSSSSVSSKAGMCKITSPLCGCGRRAKRQTVANGGPNHGRVFYCCPVRRSGNENGKGCEFFKWESALIKAQSSTSVAAGSSIFLCFNSSRLPPHTLSSRKSW